MYPVDNNYIDYHKSVFLDLLLVLLATGLGMIGFHKTFLWCIDTPGTPTRTLYCTFLLQDTSSSEPLVSDDSELSEA